MPHHIKTCLVSAQHLSHYRSGVYRVLDSQCDWQFTFAGGVDVRDASIPGIPPGTLKDQRTLRDSWLPGGLLWQHGLLHLIRWHKYDVAIFVGDVRFLSTWVSSILLRMRGVRVYFWTIGWHRPERGVKRWLRKSFYRLADGLLLYGQDGLELARQAGMSEGRLHVIGNSHDVADAVEGRGSSPPPHPEGEPITVGAVVRLRSGKRFDILLQALSLLKSQGVEVRALLVGDGPVLEALKDQASQLEIPVEFPGAVYDPIDIRDVYQRLTITVLPELAGLSVVQSLAFGVPVVTVDDPWSQVPEFRAVVPGVTGELYAKGDVPDLAAKIVSCLAMLERDPSRVAAACQAEVRGNWTPLVHARRILDVLG